MALIPICHTHKPGFRRKRLGAGDKIISDLGDLIISDSIISDSIISDSIISDFILFHNIIYLVKMKSILNIYFDNITHVHISIFVGKFPNI